MAAISELTATETAASRATKSAAEEAGRALASAGPVTKLIVAIHGIGDQYRYATIRSVVKRFAAYCDSPAPVPLGSFHAERASVAAFRVQVPPNIRSSLENIDFAEVYWAHIPRALQREGYTLDEAKEWTRTVVERVRARYGPELKDQFDFQREDYREATDILLEMIETTMTFDKLLDLAEKIGLPKFMLFLAEESLPKFNLHELLISYLGDVQMVADFAGTAKDSTGVSRRS